MTGHRRAPTRYGARLAVIVYATVGHALSAPVAAQSMASRPTTVALTVTVPSPAGVTGPLTGRAMPVVARHTGAGFELSVPLELGAAGTTQVEVMLPAGTVPDPLKVSVRNSTGAFERLATGMPAVIAAGVPQVADVSRYGLAFRVETDTPYDAKTLAIPVELTLRVGSGESSVRWRYSVRLGFGPVHTPTAPAEVSVR